MSAIQINFKKKEESLFCKSKWWGDPDLPEDVEYPVYKNQEGYELPYTFVCQINFEQIYPCDKNEELPKEGMLYIFARLGAYTGVEGAKPLTGRLEKKAVKAVFIERLIPQVCQTITPVDKDDNPLSLPEEAISFSLTDQKAGGRKLLGIPVSKSFKEWAPPCQNFRLLLQIADKDQMVYIIISPTDLAEKKFDNLFIQYVQES
ncbi:MAG TPA: DUF1963 domain-containing protein [Bacteroidaceae bacterium]|nr:DUF1963 domain-containing protein [Bacteroidaceae bacterium]